MVDRIAHLEMIALELLDKIRALKPKEEKPNNRKKELQLKGKQIFLNNKKLRQ